MAEQGLIGYLDWADKAFSTDQKEAADAYLEKLHEAWIVLSQSIRRTLLLIAISVVIFLLLTRSAIEEVSLGPVKIKDLVLVQTFLPVFIAYQFYDLMTGMIRWDRTERVYEKLMEKFHNSIYQNDLEFLLFPPIPLTASFASEPRAWEIISAYKAAGRIIILDSTRIPGHCSVTVSNLCLYSAL